MQDVRKAIYRVEKDWIRPTIDPADVGGKLMKQYMGGELLDPNYGKVEAAPSALSNIVSPTSSEAAINEASRVAAAAEADKVKKRKGWLSTITSGQGITDEPSVLKPTLGG